MYAEEGLTEEDPYVLNVDGVDKLDGVEKGVSEGEELKNLNGKDICRLNC